MKNINEIIAALPASRRKKVADLAAFHAETARRYPVVMGALHQSEKDELASAERQRR
jgi:hypothetical protein